MEEELEVAVYKIKTQKMRMALEIFKLMNVNSKTVKLDLVEEYRLSMEHAKVMKKLTSLTAYLIIAVGIQVDAFDHAHTNLY